MNIEQFRTIARLVDHSIFLLAPADEGVAYLNGLLDGRGLNGCVKVIKDVNLVQYQLRINVITDKDENLTVWLEIAENGWVQFDFS